MIQTLTLILKWPFERTISCHQYAFFIEHFYRKPRKRLSLLDSNNDGPETMRSAEFPKNDKYCFL